MKKYLVLIFMSVFILGTSCKDGKSWFGKSGKRVKQEDFALLAKKNSELQQQIHDDSVRFAQQLAAIRNDYEDKLNVVQKNVESGKTADSNEYYIIVGSFKNQAYAQSYSDKVKSMGHEGRIIQGPGDFQLVTYGTFNSLKNSLPALNNARTGVATEAWIYFMD